MSTAYITPAASSTTGVGNPICGPCTNHFVWSFLISPFSAPSKRVTRPISLVSKFSSLCVAMTSLPTITIELFIARLLTSRRNTGSPVPALRPWNTPSVPPTIASRVPLTVAMIGVE